VRRRWKYNINDDGVVTVGRGGIPICDHCVIFDGARSDGDMCNHCNIGVIRHPADFENPALYCRILEVLDAVKIEFTG
jgi:hypothetical protein